MNRHYAMIKEWIIQEDLILINLYATMKVSKYEGNE